MEKYVFYAAGRDRRLRELAEEYVRARGGYVAYYCEDETSRVSPPGKCYPPEKIAEDPDAIVVVFSMLIQPVIKRLRMAGYPNRILAAPVLGYRFICDEYVPPKAFEKLVVDYAAAHREEAYRLFETGDPYTRKLLDSIFMQRGSFRFLNPEEIDYPGDEDYFGDALTAPNATEAITFLDCGAYIGDSLEDIFAIYGTSLQKVYAMEPEESSFKELEKTVEKLGLAECSSLHRVGASDFTGDLRFSLVKDILVRDDNGPLSLPVCPVDRIMGEVKGSLLIKMDLEGTEIAALKGAENTIRKYRPYMNICLYHKMEDLLEVPRTIASIAGGYRFYLRSGLHTICSAVPV